MSKLATNDMTKGSVSKQLVRYAIPMVLTSLLQAVYSIVDIIVAGHFIGSSGISAINNSSLIMNFMTQIAIGFTVGGNVLMSQYFGRKEADNYKKSSGTLLVLSLLLGIVSMIIFCSAASPLLVLVGAPALEEATIYLRICAVGMPVIFGYNALSATLRALGNSKAPMVFIAVSTVTNIVLDILFVAGFDMGVAGAAWATVIAQCVSFALALIYALKYKSETGLERCYFKVFKDKLKLIIRFGFPIALQMTIASISWLTVMVLINKYGVDVSAGNGVSNKIKDFCQLFISATVSAAGTMAAQNIGAGEYDRAKKVMFTCMKITMGIAVITIVVAEIFAPQLVSIFTNEPNVAVHAVRNLRIEILAQVFYAGFLTFNVLATACGDTMFVMGNSFINCIVVRLVLALILQHFIGIVGVYLACMIAPGSSVPVGFIYYKLGKWKKQLRG